MFVAFRLCSFFLHLLLLLNISSSYEISITHQHDDHHPLVFEYKQMAEVEKHCSEILSSGSKLELTDAESERLKNVLTFYNGDWEQENNGLAPLMPFDSTDKSSGMGLSSWLKLINFEVMDVRSLDDVENGVGFGGIMSIGITRSKSFSYDLGTVFSVKPGLSVLTIVFEGVYVETEGNEGERVLCMVGNTTLPSRGWTLNDQNSGEWSHKNRPMQDDQLLLVLRYLKISSLTTQAVQGEMTSIQEKENVKYFDKIIISSQLGQIFDYQFSPKQLGPCNTYAHQELMEKGANNLSGSDFCRIFQEFSREAFNILVDDHSYYDTTDRRKLGPFLLDNEFMNVESIYSYLKLIIQKVNCKQQNSDGQTGDAKVSAVFRVFPVHVVDLSTTTSRTGLSGMTLLAEGTWDSSTGKLCMFGYVPKGKEAKISMHFPRALSVRQRSIVLGSIEGLFSALHLNVIRSPFHLDYKYGWYIGSHLSYNYSKVKQADEFRKRSQSFNIIGIPHKLIYRYPTIEESGGLFSLSQVYDLTNELYIDTEVSTSKTDVGVKLEVLSIGPFIARYDFLYKVRHGAIFKDTKTIVNENGLLNVSLHLVLSSRPLASTRTNLKSVKILFMEGQYDPQTGVMYLIGCGKADTGIDVKWGLDCLIEVRIQYPPKNLQWLRDHTIEISIRSQRNAYDSLYFSPKRIKQRVTRNMFKEEEHEDIAFRKMFEGIVLIVVLAVEILIIRSQKRYMDQNVSLASSVCPNMFVIEVLSYSILFILGEKIPLPSKETVFYKKNHAYDLHAYDPALIVIDFAAKVLAVVVVILNTRLFRKVLYSRKRLNDEDPSKATHTLGDTNILFKLLKRFAFVCLVFLATSLYFPAKKGAVTMENIQTWLIKLLTELALILHDISLLSQIAENWWRKNHAKSLRKIYYVGISLVKIMVKVYDRVRSPISDPNVVNLLDTDTLAIISLVIILHIQQNFSYFWCTVCFKVSLLLNLRKLKMLLYNPRQQ